MKIAIVNDTKMAVESLRRVVTSIPEYQLAWVAYDGAEAVKQCAQLCPDVILMDLIMPVMDGVEATRQIMATSPCAILVVTSTVTGNAGKVFEAMGAGALDAVNTPVLGASGTGEGRDALLQKLRTIGRLIAANEKTASLPALKVRSTRSVTMPPMLVIGASTGGPAALAVILAAIPSGFPAAIVVVQHVDEQFTDSFVDWLNLQSSLPVRRAKGNDIPQQGEVLVAGGEQHLVLRKNGRLDYTTEPESYPYRPSVTVFFESVALHWNGRAIGVLLTGMGRDGAQGLLALRKSDFHTIAQDEASCSVYGMPKAAVQLGAVEEILPLEKIVPVLLKHFPVMLARQAE
ncbi:Chemotaxis response regulator protein-glutamate methylesterase CheB [hydrothermal vent metagenome]|uniref:protein-glutamate methylesterase n=1 Tax=hydrothermal vent metagenome TaxID=652676 RepID=A0A3B1BEK3_9ZZZZ